MPHIELPDRAASCRNLIGADWVEPTAPHAEVISPHSGAPIARVPMSGPAEVDAAVAAARSAGESWRRTPLKERTQPLFRFRELVFRDLRRLAVGAALESGKTVAEAQAGLLKGIEVVEFALSLQNLDGGGAIEVSRGVTCSSRREPLGVVAGVTPFNFPAMVPMWMFPIAVTLGNAFILKPSEKVPMTACALAELMLEAGFPPGVMSVLHGGRETCEHLADHPGVAALGFVGSTAAARAVYARAAAAGKRALCLGGAKNHLLVVPDADPELTVDGVVKAFTGCAGQRCMAASLLVAVGDVDHLIDAIVAHSGAVRLGDDMGAIIDRASLQRLHAAVDRAVGEGATLRLDGRAVPPPAGFEAGHWLAPCVLDRVRPDAECATRELFGPVLSVVRVSTLDEALTLGERNPYGNATSVFTTSGSVARVVAERAPSGMIGVNVGVPVPREPFSFGGCKQSRFGHGDITGRDAVELWSQVKKITSRWDASTDKNWMS